MVFHGTKESSRRVATGRHRNRAQKLLRTLGLVTISQMKEANKPRPVERVQIGVRMEKDWSRR
jgi:hypothetical protein